MPNNLLTVDTAFPTFTPEQTTDEKLDVVTNYLYMLLEQLRYTLQNLGAGNFNDTELGEIGKIITEPIYTDTGDTTVSGRADPNTILQQLAQRIAALEGQAING